MNLCRVLGTVTSTVKHQAFHGQKLMVVQPIDENGADAGRSFLAVDRAQAGEGDTVLVLREGTGVRQLFGLDKTASLPIRSVIVGVVDEVHAPARKD
ncbi:MAG: EutN/CcmL family microcompartment protein [Myxococcales bacterium]